jgi:hypothetical protein
MCVGSHLIVMLIHTHWKKILGHRNLPLFHPNRGSRAWMVHTGSSAAGPTYVLASALPASASWQAGAVLELPF